MYCSLAIHGYEVVYILFCCRDIGRHKSSSSIAKRVQELRLYMTIQHNSDNESDDPEQEQDNHTANANTGPEAAVGKRKFEGSQSHSSAEKARIGEGMSTDEEDQGRSKALKSQTVSKITPADWEFSAADVASLSSTLASKPVVRRKLSKKKHSSSSEFVGATLSNEASVNKDNDSDNNDDDDGDALFESIDPKSSSALQKPSSLAVMSMRQFGTSSFQIDSDDDDDLFR